MRKHYSGEINPQEWSKKVLNGYKKIHLQRG